MSQVLIAIVDDDETVRDATKQLVQSLDYNASTFGSADEFLKSEQVHDTSCLITDVQMPGLNGIDLQDRLIARGLALVERVARNWIETRFSAPIPIPEIDDNVVIAPTLS